MKRAVRGVMCPMTLRTASALAAVAATFAVAACGGSDSESSPASAAPTTAPAYDYDSPTAESTPTPEAKAVGEALTIKAASGPLGKMLVDAEGRTLYLWEADQGSKSACDGACAQAWPPLTAADKPAAGDGVDSKLLGTSERADGTLGVTYAGHPLYYFQGDTATGDANGQGSDGFGAKWWAVAPDGAAIER